MVVNYFIFLTIFYAAGSINAFPGYIKLIPNGDRVPHPCNRTLTWRAVGHEIPEGPGPRHQFGVDFYKANKTWTVELCRMDSDGDGKINGEELGDPFCVWTPGATPAVTDVAQLSHPGVCEPIDSARCAGANKFLSTIGACSAPSLSAGVNWCPAIKAPFVQSMTFRFEPTKLPGNDTFYLCKQFTVPSDSVYHIIAWEPIVTSPEVVHHLIVFACDLPDQEAYLSQVGSYENTTACPLTPACSSMVVTWAFGASKRCYGPELGIPMGKGFYKTMILQVHYSNPNLRSDFTDSSGVILYFTPVLRPNEKALLAVGQADIAIPPKQKSSVVIGRGFQGDCSRKQLAPYKTYRLASMLFHMHKTGVYGRLTLTKNATGERITIVDEAMSYDRPKVITWEAAKQLVVEPGDGFEIECRYDTSSRSAWTFWGGYSSTDEMCYAFLDIYPRPLNRMFQMPADLGDVDYCTSREPSIGQCNKNTIAGVLQNTENNKSTGMMASCNCANSYPATSCSSACYSFLSKAGLLKNPCMSGMAFHSITRFWVSPVPQDIYNIQSQTNLCVNATAPPANGTTCVAPKQAGGSNQDNNSGPSSSGGGGANNNNNNSNDSNNNNTSGKSAAVPAMAVARRVLLLSMVLAPTVVDIILTYSSLS